MVDPLTKTPLLAAFSDETIVGVVLLLAKILALTGQAAYRARPATRGFRLIFQE